MKVKKHTEKYSITEDLVLAGGVGAGGRALVGDG